MSWDSKACKLLMERTADPSVLVRALETQILMGKSDFGATHSTVDSANSGMDMELPGEYFCEARRSWTS